MSRTLGRDFTLNSGATIHAEVSQPKNHTKELPVLCLSGFGCSHYNFVELEKDLGDFYPMVLVDNRGLGKSSPAPEDYKLEDVVEDAIEVMDHLGHQRFHVMGISMGGFLSQILTLKYGDRVESLTLMCTTSGGEEYVPMPEMTEEMLKGFYMVPEPKRTEMAVEATVHPSLKERAFGRFQGIVELRRSHPVIVEQILKQKRAVDAFLKNALPLEKLTVPTFILSGDADRFVSPKNAEILHAKIKNSQLKFIEDSDHLFFLERPRLVGRAVRTFLSQFPDAPQPEGVNTGAEAGAL